MTVAGFLAKLQRARRQDAPRVTVTLMVFRPDDGLAVKLENGNG